MRGPGWLGGLHAIDASDVFCVTISAIKLDDGGIGRDERKLS